MVRENPVVVVRSSPSHPLVIWLATVLALLASAAAVLLTHAREHFATGMLWMIGCATPTVLAVALFRHYRTANAAHEHALREMAARSQTVDRLLDFSQTIQGAGKPEQIFDSLALFLHTELSLSGVAIIAHDPDALPPTSLKSVFPATLNRSGCSLAEMDTAMCPCLRQNLPKCFKPDASPVRCSVDEALRLPPDHPAYCIPFTVGRKTQVMVHMLLPPNEQWTEDRRQLAQTYINTASSSLITLHHLSEAERQSMTDALTGLYNRRSMEQLLQRELALSERHGQALSLVMIDMDKFKEINDEHGHAAGDHMLRAFADCVRITLRKTDLAFRYGGDEFVIALPQTGVDQAKAVVQKLRQAYSAVDFSGAIAHLATQPTLSIGVAERSVRDNIITLPTLLAAADSALYEAKKADRNCIKIYSGPQAA